MNQPHPHRSALKRIFNVLTWVLIALLLAATLWAVVWARKQPRVHSIRGEPSDVPLTRNYDQMHNWQPLAMGLGVFKDDNDSNRN